MRARLRYDGPCLKQQGDVVPKAAFMVADRMCASEEHQLRVTDIVRTRVVTLGEGGRAGR